MAKGRKAALSSKPSIEDFDTLPTQNVTSNDYSNSTGNEETEQNPFSKFVYVDEMIKALNLGFTMNRNLIFFGKGGFGKSEISELFFMTKGITPFVMSMGFAPLMAGCRAMRLATVSWPRWRPKARWGAALRMWRGFWG